VSSWFSEFTLDQKTSAETALARQQCLYFFPLPQLQRSFLPSLVFSVADRWGMFPVPSRQSFKTLHNTLGILVYPSIMPWFGVAACGQQFWAREPIFRL
jgi:hypothetical protein